MSKKKKSKVFNVPLRTFQQWFGEYLLARMVVEAYAKSHKLATRLKPGRMVDDPDGGATFHYQVYYD